eukprot:gb/GFBE01075055.1/.p1 GENE.gb/GFBE01075055.1/~~gb/GFBE01075055.1/.p1  ORF type:complete len:362 (+),score=19.00 gb/GFBE01075055.1/:1-1086(+)
MDQLALVPASGADRDRRRRRRDDGDGKHRRHGSRSRSRRRHGHRSGGGGGGGDSGPPPADWRGPGGASAPQDWRGPPPSEWQGYGPPGAWPPRTMGAYPPPGNWPPRPMGAYPPSGRAEPPGEWRGPGAAAHPPPYSSHTPGAWAPSGPPPSDWGGNTGGPPVHWGAPPQASYPPKPEAAALPAIMAAPAALPGMPPAAVPAAEPVAEVPLPEPEKPVEKLRRMKIVASAVSESMKEKLRSLGILSKKETSDAEKGKEVTRSGFLAAGLTGAAAAQAQCAHLGLLTAGPGRSRLPPPVQGKQRLPACTLGLVQTGLWERFRQRCGTPLPPEPTPVPAELKSSRGGGFAVVPAIAGAEPKST